MALVDDLVSISSPDLSSVDRMGAIGVHVNASEPSAHRSAGIHINKGGGGTGGCAKPHIIHTYSPMIYKVQPEEFLEFVQKLTGQKVRKPRTTFQFFDIQPSKSGHDTDSRSKLTRGSIIGADSDESIASPFVNHRLASPKLVTLNFLPLLSSPTTTTNCANLQDIQVEIDSSVGHIIKSISVL